MCAYGIWITDKDGNALVETRLVSDQRTGGLQEDQQEVQQSQGVHKGNEIDSVSATECEEAAAESPPT